MGGAAAEAGLLGGRLDGRAAGQGQQQLVRVGPHPPWHGSTP
jgi:hypothetical protein